MPATIPDLHLSHGQLVWAACYGRAPSKVLTNRVRYLRQLGVPRFDDADNDNRGRRTRYTFDDLCILGIGLTALSFGVKPRDVGRMLNASRADVLAGSHTAWKELPEGVLDEPWVRSRGASVPVYEDEFFLRLQDPDDNPLRDRPIFAPDDPTQPWLYAIEHSPGEPVRRNIPLKRLMVQWVAWALEAPEMKPGRK